MFTLPVVIVGLIAISMMFVVAVDRKVEQRFNKRWPPISDDEFLAKCSSSIDPEIALRVRAIISDVYGIPYNQIYPDQNLIDDLEP